ncbi:MAG: acyl-CoA dehydrogenase family protein, partial [Elusimicrobia bacterium]|nr:acyl-CoA dehydrogenase family protein [Elusimicrobiota bacterium]
RDRGGPREDGAQEARLQDARRGVPQGHDPGVEHVLPFDHRDRGLDLAAGQGHRHALHEPGAGDAARRVDPRDRDDRRDLRPRQRPLQDARQGTGVLEGLPRLHLEPHPDADDQRGVLRPHGRRRHEGRHRHRDEARHEPPDGPAGAGRPHRFGHLPLYTGSAADGLRRPEVPPLPAVEEDGRGRTPRPQNRKRLLQLPMNFEYTDEQKMARDTAREFAKKRLAPLAQKLDEEEHTPRELYAEAAELGFFGILMPEEYGGLGLDHVAYCLVMEEIARACAAFQVCLTVHNSLVSTALLKFGTEEQRKKWLPQLASGAKIAAYSLSEPGAGSDAGSVKCAARLEGGHYVLNGTKSWISSGDVADYFLVFVQTDPALKSRGVSCLFVERNTPGLTVGKKEKKLGIRSSSTNEVHFKDAKVPAANLIGTANEGFKVALTQLDGGRMGIAAQAVGIAQAAFDEAVSYTRQRQQFGKNLADFQATQFKLADMSMKIDAARLLTLRAAALLDGGKKATREASAAKLFASETANQVAYQALQLHGGNGYVREFPVERYFRDARITEIYEGTSEIQRLVISREVLKEAAETAPVAAAR